MSTVPEQSVLDFPCTPHPVFRTITPADKATLLARVGVEESLRLLRLREQGIANEAADPFRCGHEPRHWADADEILNARGPLIHNTCSVSAGL